MMQHCRDDCAMRLLFLVVMVAVLWQVSSFIPIVVTVVAALVPLVLVVLLVVVVAPVPLVLVDVPVLPVIVVGGRRFCLWWRW